MMEYKNKTVAISWDDHKLCSLFFDHVYPVGDEKIPSGVESTHLPNTDEADFYSAILGLCALEAPFVSKTIAKTGDGKEIKGNFVNESGSRFAIAYMMYHTLIKNGYTPIPIFGSLEAYEKIWNSLFLNYEHALMPVHSIEFTTYNANLIDTSRLTWEQIIEFKKDEESRRKLRNYKLFMYDQFSGKSKDYIIDHLSKKIEEYEEACKKHGFKLVSSTLSSVLNSKSAIAMAGIVAAGIITGISTVKDIGLISGAVIEIGKISLGISEKMMDMRSFKNNHELAYIFEIKDKLSKF